MKFFSMTGKPRIVFLIPMASARVVKDWHLACAYFKQTLASVFNSTAGNYCVVVVGHEAPDFPLPQDPRFKFLSLNHPLPSQENGYWIAAIKDKRIKLEAAWNYAKSKWNPHYVMKVDWDDLVSSRLVGWLNTASEAAGYCIRHGWVWNSRSRYIMTYSELFDLVCGTCLIIRNDLADSKGPFLNSMDGAQLDGLGKGVEAADNRTLVPGAGTGSLLLNDSHGRAEAQFRYLGHQLATVPFRAAVYRVQVPNSVSQRGYHIHSLRWLLGRIRRTRLISASLRKEFMLDLEIGLEADRKN
jgi:hypothetical protein